MNFKFNILKKIQIENIYNLIFCLFIFFWSIRFEYFQIKYLILILIIPIFFKLKKKDYKKNLGLFIFALILIFHSFFSNNSISVYSLFSIIFFIFILIIIKEFKNHILKNLKEINFYFLTIFLFFFSLNFLIFGNKTFSNICYDCKNLNIYIENSHFALSILPVIFYLIFFNDYTKKKKFFFLSVISLICFFNPSVTLFVGLLLIIFFIVIFKMYKAKTKYIILLTLFIITIFFSVIENTNKIFNFVNIYFDKKPSLSTEVYKHSIYIAKKSLINKPLGYGFNNYQIAFDQFKKENYTREVNKKIYAYPEISYLNRQDGSNNFVKLIVEFGVFSILIFILIISFLISKKIEKKIKILLLLPVILQLFVRGVGYFNGGFIIYFLIIYFLWLDSKKYKIN